jgi:hypothetical protein
MWIRARQYVAITFMDDVGSLDQAARLDCLHWEVTATKNSQYCNKSV